MAAAQIAYCLAVAPRAHCQCPAFPVTTLKLVERIDAPVGPREVQNLAPPVTNPEPLRQSGFTQLRATLKFVAGHREVHVEVLVFDRHPKVLTAAAGVRGIAQDESHCNVPQSNGLAETVRHLASGILDAGDGIYRWKR